jgi:hypothetical protein
MTGKGQDNTRADKNRSNNTIWNSSYYLAEVHEDGMMLLKWILCCDNMYGIILTTTLMTVSFSRMNVPMCLLSRRP